MQLGPWDITGDPPLRLELLTMQHLAALERFERTNRSFFARHVTDRGDDYFTNFENRAASLVQENDAGQSLCFVVLIPSQEIIGRVNVLDIDEPGQTELGFRVAERVLGQGVATRAVTKALEVARTRSVRAVAARTSTNNVASRRVLERCDFTPTGPAASPDGTTTSFLGHRRQLDPETPLA